MSYLPGAKVYIKLKGAWSLAEVGSAGGGKVTTTNGDTVPESECCAYSAVAAQGLDDIINLDVLHAGSILHNLETRFDADKIYTYVGSILLSVNPFKPIPIFGDDQVETYAKADVMAIKDGTLKPHIFAVAKDSFEQMLRDQKFQSVIISGESGAGKTEATKYVLKYLTAVSSKAGAKDRTGASKDLSPVDKMIIQSSPILEAFGNAKTVRNNNSSRFGKYFEIQFSGAGEITGGVITDYLLEKSRVVSPAENERGYYIFYLLCKGCSPEEKAKYQLLSLSDYNYTNMSGCYDVEGVDEVAEYNLVQMAFSDCKMTNLEVDAIKRILSAILHLGNCKFESAEDDDPCELSGDSASSVKAVATLMDFSESQLSNSLTQRTMSTGGRGSVYKIKLKKKEAEAARDALAKHMYLQLFSWIVKKVSDNMKAEKPPAFSIGVLDIFGFEVMPVNSFEQLCINFANEKLHQQFIHYVFALEMEEYDKEKLGITIEYEDNKECVELIEKKGTGILGILQEQCQLGARGSDAEFLNNTIQTYNKHKYFIVEKRSRTEFSVSHYANPVKYETEGFLEKNRDSVNDDIRSLVDSTKMPEIKSIIKKEDASDAAAGARGRRKKVATVANKFKESLQTLVSVINSTTPHYVRCLKSTEKKMPGIFDGANMNRQLGYSGVLETIKVRLAGYAVRMDYVTFTKRFAILVGKVSGQGKDAAMEILKKSNIDIMDTKIVACGITKVFLKRESLLLQLEKAREKFLLSSIIVIQRYWRREFARRKFQKLKEEAKRKAEEEAKRKAEEERKKKEEAEAGKRLQNLDQQETTGEEDSASRERSTTEQSNALKNVSMGSSDSSMCTFLNIKDRVMVLGYTPMATNHRNKVDTEAPGISMEPVMIKGWLAKEGSKGFTTGRFNNWNKRFFVMKKDRIVYYSNESLKDKKGDFQLETSSSVTEIPESYHKNLPTGVGNHFFQVNIRNRSTKLACDTEMEKSKWMDGISTAILQLKSGIEKVKTGSDFSVHMPDRSVLTSSVKTSNAKDVFLKVATTVAIQKGIQFFSLVKAYTTPDRLEFYNVFSERDNCADLGPFRLAFYRVISLKGKDDLSDPKLLTVEYSQTVRANLMFFEYDEKDAIELAALQLKVKEGTISSVTHTRGFLAEDLHEYMPDSQLMRYGGDVEVTNKWEADILNRAAEIEDSKKSVNECMEEYIKKSQENSLYGGTFFEVSMIRDESDYAYILGVNSTGLHVIDRKTRALVVSFPYVSIMRWSRSSKKFNFTTQGENHWTMLTKQGEEINKFMGIYVRFLLDNKD